MKRNKVLRGGFSEPLDFTFFLSLSIVLIYTHTRTRSRVHVEAYIPVAARNTRPRKNTKRDARTRSRKLSFSLLHTSSPHSISPFTLTLALAPCALAFPLSTLVICPPSLPFPSLRVPSMPFFHPFAPSRSLSLAALSPFPSIVLLVIFTRFRGGRKRKNLRPSPQGAAMVSRRESSDSTDFQISLRTGRV